jgi:hypothetical protein
VSLHGPDPSYYAEMEQDQHDRLREERYDESVQERTDRSYRNRNASSCRPRTAEEREAYRVAWCEAEGVDPFPKRVGEVRVLPARPVPRRDAA